MSITITSISSNISPAVHQLYEQAFPEHERRTWKHQEILVKNGNLLLLEIKWNAVFAGFIFYWQLTDFLFIEHFAIAKNARGKGMGSKILEQFTERFNTLVLETEPPEVSTDAARRITFYEKAGFILFDEAYMQPPYTKGGAWFPMRLMYRKPDRSNISFEQVKREIYAEVYGIK